MRPLWRALQPVLRWSHRLDRLITRLTAAVTAAQFVDRPASFVARDLARRGSVGGYRLRGTDVSLHVRHGTPDAAMISEIFHHGVYEPPPAIVERLGPAGPAKILDLGANIGMFGVWARHRFAGAEITAVEPDRFNAAVLRRTVAGNGQDRWKVLEAAAGSAEGRMAFTHGAFWLSKLEPDAPADGDTVDVIDVLPMLVGVDLLKLDIEGGEWPILLDPRFKSVQVPTVIFEYHPHMSPERDAREASSRAFQAAGYRVEPVFHDEAGGHGVAWAWRPEGPLASGV